jgi:cytochrome bd-type quinol oxidase subunit 2
LDALSLHRIRFAVTITYHYLFPQLTMGLTLLIVLLKTLALRTTDPDVSRLYDTSARFWGRLFAINFLLGVVTGIPIEFPFGANRRRHRHAARHGRNPFVLSRVVLPWPLSRGFQLRCFLASCGYLSSMLLGAAFGLFPVVLPAVGMQGRDLTVEQAQSSKHTLQIGLVWWSVGICLAIIPLHRLSALPWHGACERYGL